MGSYYNFDFVAEGITEDESNTIIEVLVENWSGDVDGNSTYFGDSLSTGAEAFVSSDDEEKAKSLAQAIFDTVGREDFALFIYATLVDRAPDNTYQFGTAADDADVLADIRAI